MLPGQEPMLLTRGYIGTIFNQVSAEYRPTVIGPAKS